jgi:hypothetical protein
MFGAVAVRVGVATREASADQITWRPLQTNATVWRPKSHNTSPRDSSHCTPKTMSKEPRLGP